MTASPSHAPRGAWRWAFASWQRLRSLVRAALPQPKLSKFWPWIHLVALVAFALRYTLALASENAFWPDEMFQYLEQGHRVANGFGYIPWEYRIGIRSWVIPGLIGGLLEAGNALGLDRPESYIPLVKGFFCLLASSVVYAGYAIGRSAVSELAGRLAACTLCVWYELVYFAHKPTPEALSVYLLLGALATAVSARQRAWLFGALAGAVLVLRFQYFPAVAVLGAFVLVSWDYERVWKAIAAALLVVAATGVLDYFTWGRLFGSYVNNYVFNRTHDVSSRFGVRPFWYFIPALTIASGGLIYPALVLGARRVASWLPLACAGSIVLLHSLIPHKEYRFILSSVPLILVALALSIALLAESRPRWRWQIIGAAAALLVAVSALGLARRLPGQSHLYVEPLTHRDELADLYVRLGHDPDLKGILDFSAPERSIPSTGAAYYYLHRRVPTYFYTQLRERHIPIEQALTAASHVITPRGAPLYAGFSLGLTSATLQVQKRSDPNSPCQPLPFDSFNTFALLPEEAVTLNWPAGAQ